MSAFPPFTSRALIVPLDNIDTDQIIPARYLKTTNKQGLGDQLFYDWRYDEQGNPNSTFILNQPGAKDAHILIAGHNFGCGSSREHAPWALQGYGFQGVISTYFADIFKNNALKNGLLPVQVSADVHHYLVAAVESDPNAQITIDLESSTITLPDGRVEKFPIDGFARQCLLKGVDQLGYLLDLDPQIAAFESGHPARVDTLA